MRPDPLLHRLGRPWQKGLTGLCYAAMNGFEDVVQLLIESKAEVDTVGKVLQVCLLAFAQTLISTTISTTIFHQGRLVNGIQSNCLLIFDLVLKDWAFKELVQSVDQFMETPIVLLFTGPSFDG